MSTLFKLEKLLQKYLSADKRRADKPDFIKIQMSIKENLMNNPVVSKVYKVDSITKEPVKSIPSSEISRILSPSGKLQFGQESDSKPKAVNDGRLKSARGAKPSEDMCPYPDLEILKSALDSLFTSTYIHDDRILVEFMKGLAKITINTIEDNKSTQNVVPTIKKEEATFGIVKIFEVALINLNRIELIWDNVIINELGSITYSKQEEGKAKYLNNEWLTQIMTEAIWIIIEEIFDRQIKNEQIKLEIDLEEAYEQKDESEIDSFLSGAWIGKIFEPLEKEMKSDFYK